MILNNVNMQEKSLVNRFKEFVQEVREKTKGVVTGVSEDFIDKLISKIFEVRVRPILEEQQKMVNILKETSEVVKEVRELEKQILNTLVEIRDFLKSINDKLVKHE